MQAHYTLLICLESRASLYSTACSALFRVVLKEGTTESRPPIGDEASQIPVRQLPVPKQVSAAYVQKMQKKETLCYAQIDHYLSQFIIGQPYATRLLSVSVYNHFKRIYHCPRPVKQQQQPVSAWRISLAF